MQNEMRAPRLEDGPSRIGGRLARTAAAAGGSSPGGAGFGPRAFVRTPTRHMAPKAEQEPAAVLAVQNKDVHAVAASTESVVMH